MELTKKQQAGLKLAVQRYKNHEPYTCIAGLAGVGKTVLVSYIIKALNLDEDRVCYAAFTGKAASVLKEKGAPNAITTHKLLYQTKRLPDGTYLHSPRKHLEKPYKLIVIDEVSMLPEHMWNLLLSYNVHVLALGDPGQLPAITKGTEILNKPHIFLDEIMRQAQESEIIRLTMDIRDGRPIPLYRGKEVQIIDKKDFAPELYNKADIVIAATNKTRRDINQVVRNSIYQEDVPYSLLLDGDKIICLHNNWQRLNEEMDCLINGMIGNTYHVKEKRRAEFGGKYWNFNFLPEGMDEEHFFYNVNSDAHIFSEGKPYESKYRKGKPSRLEYFDYGYCITAHKSQGSEWDNVLVIEENFPYERIEHSKWLYTAATRAKKKLIVVRK